LCLSKLTAIFVHVGLSASAFFTGYVALQTLLVVRYAWTEKKMQKAEYFFFASGLGVPIITVILAAAKGLFHPMEGGFCWITQSAVDECTYLDGGVGDLDEGDGDPLFDEGEGGPLLDAYCKNLMISKGENFFNQAVLAIAWILLVMLGILFSMISLYLFVRQNERQAARWSTNAQEGRQQKRVLTKSIAVIGAYFFTWIPSILALIPAIYTAMNVVIINTIVAAVLPLQGFFNALIFSGYMEKCIRRICFGKRGSEAAPPRSSLPVTEGTSTFQTH